MATNNPGQPQGTKSQPQSTQPTTQQSRETGERGQGTGRQIARRESYFPSMGGFGLSGSPFSMIRRMMEDMENMLGGSFFGSGMVPGTRGRPNLENMFNPNIDLEQRDNHLIVRADLPGMEKDNVRLMVTDDGLLIEGERKDERKEEDRGFIRQERMYGSFRRLIPLPEGINSDQVRAEMKNGVLEVTIPLANQQQRGKQIEIQGESQKPSVH